MATFFFCGVGGIGMSAIALYLKKSGHKVLGSDRAFDMGKNSLMKESLLSHGIELFPQDGSGVTMGVDVLVVSSAVEPSILDVKKALDLEIKIQKRAQVLADIFHTFKQKIAIAGTSGKTTVTAMTGHILYQTQLHPVMINGGIGLNAYHDEELSNLIFDTGDVCVIEADESDGSIELYNPYVAVLTNVSLDHKPLEEIKPLFEAFLKRAQKGCVINKDCIETKNLRLPESEIVSFSVEGDPTATLYASNVHQTEKGISFNLNGQNYILPLIGLHNLSNALAAIAASLLVGVSLEEAIKALSSFKGTKRRLENVGCLNGITVVDDYAHNEEKIKASMQALKGMGQNLFIVYQSHGFAPLQLMKEGLIQMLKSELNENINWLMLPVYYVGGTVQKTISSKDIVSPLIECKKNACSFDTRQEVISYLMKNAKVGDVVAVMGARDDTLSLFAKEILINMGDVK